MTKHGHHEHCEHEEVAYCGHCQVVYCRGCKREWSDCKLNHGYTYYYPWYPNTTPTHPIYGAGDTTTLTSDTICESTGGAGVTIGSTACTHA